MRVKKSNSFFVNHKKGLVRDVPKQENNTEEKKIQKSTHSSRY